MLNHTLHDSPAPVLWLSDRFQLNPRRDFCSKSQRGPQGCYTPAKLAWNLKTSFIHYYPTILGTLLLSASETRILSFRTVLSVRDFSSSLGTNDVRPLTLRAALMYLESQVAQNNRPPYPKAAHNLDKVAQNYRPMAFRVANTLSSFHVGMYEVGTVSGCSGVYCAIGLVGGSRLFGAGSVRRLEGSCA